MTPSTRRLTLTVIGLLALTGLALINGTAQAVPIGDGPSPTGPPQPSGPPRVETVMHDEGEDGYTSADVSVSLPVAAAETVTGHVRTRSVTAREHEDYRPIADAVFTIERGATTAHVLIQIRGDTRCEPDETLLVEVFSVSAGAVVAPLIEVVIVNDDVC